MRLTAILVAVLLVFVAASNSGCKGCASKVAEQAMEKAVETASGGKADIDVGSNIDVSGLPEALRYPGAAAKASWTMAGEDGSGTAYTFETADPRATVVTHYKNALAGWKSKMSSETEEATILSYGSADEKEFATVTVGTSDNKTTLTVLYIKKP